MVANANQLKRRVAEYLSSGQHENDCRLTAQIALDFCRMLEPSMDDEQRFGIASAIKYLGDGRDGSRIDAINAMAGRIQLESITAAHSAKAALNRLVFSALNSVTGLDDFAGEFLIDMAFDAGLSETQILGVLTARLPKFDPPQEG